MIRAVLRVGRAIEVEVEIPNDKHLTSMEVAVFQKITELTQKGRRHLVCFSLKEGVYTGRRSERFAVR